MVWLPFSDAARLLLSGDHTPVSRVDILQAGKAVYTLTVTGGRVDVDASRAVRRNLAATLIDPTGALTKGDVEDLLDPYECEIAVWRGVRTASGDESAPAGVFGLTGRTVSDTENGLVISIDGQDRTMGYQGPMVNPLSIQSGTPIEEAIFRLLARRNPGVTFDAMNTGFVTGPLLYAPDIDVWREATDLATSAGASLFHDRTGRCVLAPDGPATDTPVRVWQEGDGLLLGVNRKEDSDTIHNVITAESESGLFSATVRDDNPASPTYSRGRYGEHPDTITSQHIGSQEQAQQAAAARLIYELGRSETTTLEVVPDPALDVQEIVTVHRPRAGLVHRDLIVESFTLPLGPSESMQVGCRKSVLTADGRFLRALPA